MEQLSFGEQNSRLLSEQQAKNLKQEVLQTALAERPEAVGTNLEAVKIFIDRALAILSSKTKCSTSGKILYLKEVY